MVLYQISWYGLRGKLFQLVCSIDFSWESYFCEWSYFSIGCSYDTDFIWDAKIKIQTPGPFWRLPFNCSTEVLCWISQSLGAHCSGVNYRSFHIIFYRQFNISIIISHEGYQGHFAHRCVGSQGSTLFQLKKENVLLLWVNEFL